MGSVPKPIWLPAAGYPLPTRVCYFFMLLQFSPHLPPVTLAASLMRYQYNNGEKRFQEQLQPIYSKQKLQKLYYCICFGQTSENKLEIELDELL